MKKLIGIICLSACIAALCSCEFLKSEETPNVDDGESVFSTQTEPITEAETEEIDYYYNVLEMQNVSLVRFTRKEDMYDDNEYGHDSICVIAQCPNCGKEPAPIHINPEDLDFSSGDSIQYSSVENCYQYSFDGKSGNYTWIIGITREPDWRTYQN